MSWNQFENHVLMLPQGTFGWLHLFLISHLSLSLCFVLCNHAPFVYPVKVSGRGCHWRLHSITICQVRIFWLDLSVWFLKSHSVSKSVFPCRRWRSFLNLVSWELWGALSEPSYPQNPFRKWLSYWIEGAYLSTFF